MTFNLTQLLFLADRDIVYDQRRLPRPLLALVLPYEPSKLLRLYSIYQENAQITSFFGHRGHSLAVTYDGAMTVQEGALPRGVR